MKDKERGFTLVEVLVSLLVAVLLVGSVMALIEVSLRNERRINHLVEAAHVLDSAGQYILENPKFIFNKVITLKEFPGSPTVNIEVTPVKGNLSTKLYRVKLIYEGEILEFSIIVEDEKM